MLTGNEREQSEFNYALAYLERIHNIFLLCSESAAKNDIYTWSRALHRLYCELSTRMNKEERENKLNELKKIFDDINNLVTTKQYLAHKQIPPDIVWRLTDFEIYHREIMSSSGLELRFKEDARQALR